MNLYLKQCARCKRSFGDFMVRRCLNDDVNRLLGDYICYYCCKRCKHHTKAADCGGIGCGYNVGYSRD